APIQPTHSSFAVAIAADLPMPPMNRRAAIACSGVWAPVGSAERAEGGQAVSRKWPRWGLAHRSAGTRWGSTGLARPASRTGSAMGSAVSVSVRQVAADRAVAAEERVAAVVGEGLAVAREAASAVEAHRPAEVDAAAVAGRTTAPSPRSAIDGAI